MPLELLPAELETAARAWRAMAYQESEQAKRMENPSTRGPVEAMVRRYVGLAERFEAARKKTGRQEIPQADRALLTGPCRLT
jgi:hypothetical protein